ncbi:MAG: glycosyltransferase family 1 protein, partial [Parvibaculum sp.]
MSQVLDSQAVAPIVEPLGEAPRRDATIEAIKGDRPLRILLPSYRSNSTTGGQGVYMRHISKALVDLGHHVDVISGPPYP